MASDLRKGISLDSNNSHNPASMYSYWNQRGFILETQTRWVRLWADWSELQPEPSNAFDHARWGDLDGQIRQAIRDGLYVMLTAYRVPYWANGARRYTLGVSDPERGKFVVPDVVEPYDNNGNRGPWSQFIEHLTVRYNPGNPANDGAFVHCVEVMNEPNIQMLPLWEDTSIPSADWKPVIPQLAGKMMRTAQVVKNGINGAKDFWPILVGPATGDTDKKSANRMPYDVFTRELIADHYNRGFRPGAWYAWSHHNHRDIETDAGSGSDFWSGPQINRAQHARSLISGKWYGWGNPTNPNDPKIFLTEGGARLTEIKDEWFDKKNRAWTPALLRDKQAQLLQRQINRMTSSTEGAGMSMMMHYLMSSHWVYDTGLRDSYIYNSEASYI